MEEQDMSEWENLEALRQSLGKAPAPSFGPYFSGRVMRAIGRLEESSPENLYRALFSAFYRIGLAGLAAVLLLFVWIRIHPHADPEIREADQSLEQELESAGYQSLEEII